MDKKTYIPKSGAWIMVRSIIPVEVPIDPLSLWFAVPTGAIFVNGEQNIGRAFDYNFDLHFAMKHLGVNDWDVFKRAIGAYIMYGKSAPFGKKKMQHVIDLCGGVDDIEIEQQVQIKTIFGDVVIQPHEYTICNNLPQYFEAVRDGHAFLRYMTKSDSLSGKVADQIFYLRSRGIGYADALQLAWQNIKSQNQFYIEFHPAYLEQFTRGWDEYLIRKIKYCNANGRGDLLDYGKSWSMAEFLSEYASQKNIAA